MEQKQIARTHRVGTVTFGCILIVFGVLFLMNIFIPALDYATIIRLWPCVFIFLGIEILISNYRFTKYNNTETGVNFIYDKTAIFLMICLFFFAMIMALCDFGLQNSTFHI